MRLSLRNRLRLRQLYVWHIISPFCTIHKSSVSPGFVKQIMPILRILCYNGSLVTWTVVSLTAAKSSVSPGFVKQIMPILRILCYNGRKLDRRQVRASCIFYVWLRHVLCREHVHSHDFVWILLVAYTILLHNRTHTEGWKPCVNRGPVCIIYNSIKLFYPAFDIRK
jgi:hypothetical protein